jgi:alpha-L-fucosidase 2
MTNDPDHDSARRGAPVSTHVITRNAPATRWLEALPLGNGRIGAMVWGDPTAARFSLNESTFWSGSPRNNDRRATGAEDAARIREQARELFVEGREADAQKVLEGLGNAWCQAYQPIGDLVVKLGRGTQEDAGATRDADGRTGADFCSRELDLRTAVHCVRDAAGEHTTFVSWDDEVLVHAFPVPAGDHRRGAVITVDLETPEVVVSRHEISPSAGAVPGLDLVLRSPSDVPPGHAVPATPISWDEDGASRAAVAVRWRQDGDRVLLVTAIATTWQGFGTLPDRPLAEVTAQAANQAEQELHERHLASLPPETSAVDLEFTGSPEAELLTTCFHYGRHLMISAARPGLPPANLQGIWNRELTPPWSSNYTVNINLEMNHWGAALAQAPGAVGALEGYVAMLREAGRETAARLYGADGWTVHHNSDPWGYSDPVSGNPQWATWPMGGLWLERELDSLATFRGLPPHELAEQRFEARREISRFALDLLVESSTDPTKLVTFPSTSPENEWTDAHGTALALTEGGGMDRWLVRETFENLLEAARELGREDDPVVRRVSGALPRVEGPRIGADGRVLEWHADGLPEVEPHHRHVSHLSYLYPGTISDPALDAAAAATLEARGDEATGWSLVWKTCLWARLHRPDRVENLLRLFVRDAEPADAPGTERSGLYPNLFSAHPPFQIDGNLGIVAGIGEALVQSHRGEIELLPALAPVIASGSVRGLVARPGVEVSLTWADGRPSAITLRALGAGGRGTHRVRFQDRVVDVELTDARPVQVTLLKD